MSYSVYIHTNKVNGKRYVGVTRIDPERRWSKGNGYKNNPYFDSAIKKYGWDNFEHFVVEVDTAEKMYELEKQCIDFYDTTNPNKGYNISKGGDKGHYLGKDCGTKEYNRVYYAENRDKFKKNCRKYYESHKEKEKERCRIYRLNHKDEISERNRAYREKHLEEERNRCREYRKRRKIMGSDCSTSPLW